MCAVMRAEQHVLLALGFVLLRQSKHVHSQPLRLTADPDPAYFGEGVNLYCQIEQPVQHISLDGPPGMTTAIYCRNASDCKSNYAGYFFDKVASNNTRLVFSIFRPAQRDSGVWTCGDGSHTASVELNLLTRQSGCETTRTSTQSVTSTVSETTTETTLSTSTALTDFSTPENNEPCSPCVCPCQSTGGASIQGYSFVTSFTLLTTLLLCSNH